LPFRSLACRDLFSRQIDEKFLCQPDPLGDMLIALKRAVSSARAGSAGRWR
jgi:hypothetical protein